MDYGSPAFYHGSYLPCLHPFAYLRSFTLYYTRFGSTGCCGYIFLFWFALRLHVTLFIHTGLPGSLRITVLPRGLVYTPVLPFATHIFVRTVVRFTHARITHVHAATPLRFPLRVTLHTTAHSALCTRLLHGLLRFTPRSRSFCRSYAYLHHYGFTHFGSRLRAHAVLRLPLRAHWVYRTTRLVNTRVATLVYYLVCTGLRHTTCGSPHARRTFGSAITCHTHRSCSSVRLTLPAVFGWVIYTHTHAVTRTVAVHACLCGSGLPRLRFTARWLRYVWFCRLPGCYLHYAVTRFARLPGYYLHCGSAVAVTHWLGSTPPHTYTFFTPRGSRMLDSYVWLLPAFAVPHRVRLRSVCAVYAHAHARFCHGCATFTLHTYRTRLRGHLVACRFVLYHCLPVTVTYLAFTFPVGSGCTCGCHAVHCGLPRSRAPRATGCTGSFCGCSAAHWTAVGSYAVLRFCVCAACRLLLRLPDYTVPHALVILPHTVPGLLRFHTPATHLPLRFYTHYTVTHTHVYVLQFPYHLILPAYGYRVGSPAWIAVLRVLPQLPGSRAHGSILRITTVWTTLVGLHTTRILVYAHTAADTRGWLPTHWLLRLRCGSHTGLHVYARLVGSRGYTARFGLPAVATTYGSLRSPAGLRFTLVTVHTVTRFTCGYTLRYGCYGLRGLRFVAVLPLRATFTRLRLVRWFAFAGYLRFTLPDFTARYGSTGYRLVTRVYIYLRTVTAFYTV